MKMLVILLDSFKCCTLSFFCLGAGYISISGLREVTEIMDHIKNAWTRGWPFLVDFLCLFSCSIFNLHVIFCWSILGNNANNKLLSFFLSSVQVVWMQLISCSFQFFYFERLQHPDGFLFTYVKLAKSICFLVAAILRMWKTAAGLISATILFLWLVLVPKQHAFAKLVSSWLKKVYNPNTRPDLAIASTYLY